jgi:hypothetical protein
MATSTIGQAVAALEERLFVGREHELAQFQEWLCQDAAAAEILGVSGPGGIGKTALLAAFRRQALSEHRQIIEIDGQHLRSTAGDLLAALGGGSVDTVVHRLGQVQAVVLLDSFERVARLGAFLRDRVFLRMDARVRVVIASRQPLTSLWQRDDLWHKLVRALPLEGLSRSESHLYLERRGLADRPALLEQILRATRGHPLAMSLAADLASRLQVGSLEAAPEWHLVVRGLVERLRETENSSVRELLECASIVHDFDEATLLAIAGRIIDPEAFARLCALSVVRPTPNGLTLHEEIRHLLAEDLRWRNAPRFNELRDRASSYCRVQGRSSGPVERARALTNRLYLSEHDALRTALFSDGSCADITVHAVRHWQHSEIRQAWNDDFISGLLSYPRTRLRVARDKRQQIHGIAAVLPLSGNMNSLSACDPSIEGVVATYLAHTNETTTDGPETTQLFWHILQVRPDRGVATVSTLAALLRESVEVFAQGGVHLTYASTPDHQAALEALGFESLTFEVHALAASENSTAGYVLDLRRSGLDLWMDAVTSGRLPKSPAAHEVRDALHGILVHWHDDAWLSRSAVWALGAEVPDHERLDPSRIREQIRAALSRFIEDGDVDGRLAGRAVELAYLTPRVSHIAAMERLAVSRATFYRLLKRGVQALANEFVACETF